MDRGRVRTLFRRCSTDHLPYSPTEAACIAPRIPTKGTCPHLSTNALPVDQAVFSSGGRAVCKCCCEPLLFGAMRSQNFVDLCLHGWNIFPRGAHCISS